MRAALAEWIIQSIPLPRPVRAEIEQAAAALRSGAPLPGRDSTWQCLAIERSSPRDLQDPPRLNATGLTERRAGLNRLKPVLHMRCDHW